MRTGRNAPLPRRALRPRRRLAAGLALAGVGLLGGACAAASDAADQAGGSSGTSDGDTSTVAASTASAASTRSTATAATLGPDPGDPGDPVAATSSSTTAPADEAGDDVARSDPPPRPETGAVGEIDTATVEPRLLDDPAVVWVATFDGDPWEEVWGFNYGGARLVDVHEVPGVSQHGRVLDVTSTDAKMGINRLGAFPLMGIPTLEEAWLRYSVYLPADWEAAADGKMPGLAGSLDVLDDPGGTSGGGVWEPSSWSGRVMWNNAETDALPSRPIPRTYLYVTSIGGERVEDHRAENGRIFGFGARWADSTGTAVEMQLGEWNTIEVHYVMNTPGVEDGVFEGWLYNSRHPAGIRGVRYDTVQYRDATHPGLGINQLQLAHYYGGAIGPRRAQHMYFDDFVISRAPVGPRESA
jgi:hypothetical protein